MQASDAAAWYGAAVATALGGWQIWTHHREQAVRIKVRPEAGIFGLDGGTQPALALHLTNESVRPVTVLEVGRVGGVPQSFFRLTPSDTTPLPAVVPPRETFAVFIARGRFVSAIPPGGGNTQHWESYGASGDPLYMAHGGMVFYALTSDGRRFRSAVVELKMESLQPHQTRKRWRRD